MSNSTLRRRFARRAFLAGGAAVVAMPFIARSSLAGPKVIRISTPGSPDEWQSKALEEFKKELNAAAPGQFDVQNYYNGTLFAQGTEIEAMQRGNLEVGMVSPQDIAVQIPEYSIFTTGYLMRDPKHLDAVYDGDIGKEYAKSVSFNVFIHIVRSQYLGTRHVILRQERDVKTPADMKGLKLRMPGSATWQFLGNALGANATPLAFEEALGIGLGLHHAVVVEGLGLGFGGFDRALLIGRKGVPEAVGHGEEGVGDHVASQHHLLRDFIELCGFGIGQRIFQPVDRAGLHGEIDLF